MYEVFPKLKGSAVRAVDKQWPSFGGIHQYRIDVDEEQESKKPEKILVELCNSIKGPIVVFCRSLETDGAAKYDSVSFY